MHPILDLHARPVTGHRGNAAHAPENTLESFASAIALGVDAIEFDVRLTSDGEVVVHHDPTTTRTTGLARAIATSTFGELQALDAGATFTGDGRTFPFRGTGVRIPRLADLLDAFPSIPLLIEVKVPEAARPTRRLLESTGHAARAVVDAFDSACLAPFAGSAIPVGSARPDIVRLLASAVTGLPLRSVGYRAVCVPTRHGPLPLPVGRFVRLLRPLGVPVHVWTVNDPAEAHRLWSLGVRGVVSDDPGAMIAARTAYRGASL